VFVQYNAGCDRLKNGAAFFRPKLDLEYGHSRLNKRREKNCDERYRQQHILAA